MFKLKTNTLLLLLFIAHIHAQRFDHSWQELIRSDDKWYQSKEAIEAVDNVLLAQKLIGGWPKNKQFQHPISTQEKEQLLKEKYINKGATIDNGATTYELFFLAKMYKLHKNKAYKNAYLQGIEYLLEAQYNNGGWPQFYPLKKNYSKHITYNDDAMINVMVLLQGVINRKKPYKAITLSEKTISRVKDAFHKGVEAILNTQYVQNDELTAWCAQHDSKTLLPAKARAYELPSLSGFESARILQFLMSLDKPSKRVKKAINSAVIWINKTKIEGIKVIRKRDDKGKLLEKNVVKSPDAKPIWGRFMSLENNAPFFCDRDGIKKSRLADIGQERRVGYKWYASDFLDILKDYPKWQERIASKPKKKDPYTITVSKDSTGDYTSIQDAINHSKSFPNQRVIIHIKNGVYYEKIKVHEWNPKVSLIGESKDKTIITFNAYFDQTNLGRNSTFYTATLQIDGNDFYASNLTFRNTAGDVGQAITLAINANRVLIENCNILGYQDTLYCTGENFKQYFNSCFIEGTTDFIFGRATVLFENCTIHSKRNSYITAASTEVNSPYGFVFKSCHLTADPNVDNVYLGRPWRSHAKTVFIDCKMDDHITTEGWHNWSKKDSETSSFYAEYKSTGKGANPKKRVSWSHQLKKSALKHYTKHAILNDSSTDNMWYASYKK